MIRYPDVSPPAWSSQIDKTELQHVELEAGQGITGIAGAQSGSFDLSYKELANATARVQVDDNNVVGVICSARRDSYFAGLAAPYLAELLFEWLWDCRYSNISDKDIEGFLNSIAPLIHARLPRTAEEYRQYQLPPEVNFAQLEQQRTSGAHVDIGVVLVPSQGEAKLYLLGRVQGYFFFATDLTHKHKSDRAPKSITGQPECYWSSTTGVVGHAPWVVEPKANSAAASSPAPGRGEHAAMYAISDFRQLAETTRPEVSFAFTVGSRVAARTPSTQPVNFLFDLPSQPKEPVLDNLGQTGVVHPASGSTTQYGQVSQPADLLNVRPLHSEYGAAGQPPQPLDTTNASPVSTSPPAPYDVEETPSKQQTQTPLATRIKLASLLVLPRWAVLAVMAGIAVGLILSVGVLLLLPGQDAPQPCIDNKCVDPAFVETWRKYGGVEIFGMPLDAARVEGGQKIQEFERYWMIASKVGVTPTVQFMPLGTELAARAASTDRVLDPSPPPDTEQCTAHGQLSICGLFLEYWNKHKKDAPYLFGQPITDQRLEKLEDDKEYIVQWFQNARFELHTDNRGESFVQLGRLGAIASENAQVEPTVAPSATAPNDTPTTGTAQSPTHTPPPVLKVGEFQIEGLILKRWEEYGGNAQGQYGLIGEPLEAASQPADGVRVQLFRFFELTEDTEAKEPGDIGLSLLGAEGLTALEAEQKAAADPSQEIPDCLWFTETSHNICSPFLEPWRTLVATRPASEGNSLPIHTFGFPLTEAYQPEGQAITVQWFERARMEFDPTSGKVLLAPLGVETKQRRETQTNVVTVAPPPVGAEEAETIAQCRKHIVKEGEVFVRIAQEYSVDLDELLSLNDYDRSTAGGLQPGVELIIPPCDD